MNKILVIALIALIAGCGMVAYKASAEWEGNVPRTGTFTGGSGAYTNREGFRCQILSVFLYGNLQSSNATINVVNDGVTNLLASATNVTTCLSYIDGAGGMPLEKGSDGILQFSTDTTNEVSWTVNTR